MVVGNGMLASRFKLYENNNAYVIFASGVSNSKSKQKVAYDREFNMLKDAIKANPDKHFVYFSTCSIYDPSEKESHYVLHKLSVEKYIQSNAKQFNIFRISNIVGSSKNQNTIVNYYLHHIKNNINFDLWQHATRNLIGLDDVFFIIDYILQQKLFSNSIINIANEKSYKVVDIVKDIELFLKQKASYTLIPRGTDFSIETSEISEITEILNIDFKSDYLPLLLNKYFSF